MAPQKQLRRLVELPRDIYDTVRENQKILNCFLAYIDVHSNYQDPLCSRIEEAGR